MNNYFNVNNTVTSTGSTSANTQLTSILNCNNHLNQQHRNNNNDFFLNHPHQHPHQIHHNRTNNSNNNIINNNNNNNNSKYSENIFQNLATSTSISPITNKIEPTDDLKFMHNHNSYNQNAIYAAMAAVINNTSGTNTNGISNLKQSSSITATTTSPSSVTSSSSSITCSSSPRRINSPLNNCTSTSFSNKHHFHQQQQQPSQQFNNNSNNNSNNSSAIDHYMSLGNQVGFTPYTPPSFNILSPDFYGSYITSIQQQQHQQQTPQGFELSYNSTNNDHSLKLIQDSIQPIVPIPSPPLNQSNLPVNKIHQVHQSDDEDNDDEILAATQNGSNTQIYPWMNPRKHGNNISNNNTNKNTINNDINNNSNSPCGKLFNYLLICLQVNNKFSSSQNKLLLFKIYVKHISLVS